MPGQIDSIMGMLGGSNTSSDKASGGWGPGKYPGEDDWKKQKNEFGGSPLDFKRWAYTVLGDYGAFNSMAPQDRAQLYNSYQAYLSQFDERKQAALDYEMKDYAHEANKWGNWVNTNGYMGQGSPVRWG